MSRSLAKGLRQSCRDYADVAQWRDAALLSTVAESCELPGFFVLTR